MVVLKAIKVEVILIGRSYYKQINKIMGQQIKKFINYMYDSDHLLCVKVCVKNKISFKSLSVVTAFLTILQKVILLYDWPAFIDFIIPKKQVLSSLKKF